MPYLTTLLNTEFIPLDRAPEAYRTFYEGSANKFVIDPHNMTGLIGEKVTARRERAPALSP
jgi:glutathione-independent formaldehyde dehydrogenase